MDSGVVLVIGLMIAIVIGSIWYEHHNPCLEWGPQYIARIDPETGFVTYSRNCLKRTN